MVTEDQTEIVKFLSSPSTHHGAAVERVETHASVIFLAGTRALKLKRAVRYEYLDFSTAERRKTMCDAELRINRRVAPSLYLGVIPVTREQDGSLALGGRGTPVDWLLEMVRFDQDGLFDRLAERGALDRDLMLPLASAIARFHQSAEVRHDRGGLSGLTWVIDGNAAGLAEHGAGVLDSAACTSLTREAGRVLDRFGSLLDARREAGRVRQCHGDLHLRNIVLLDGRPTLFDAVEFNDRIACIDVLYDLAFLLMDLWRRRLPGHANAVLNGYLAETTDFEGMPLLPLFLSCRAAVRAKTSVTAAGLQSDVVRRRESEQLARGYLEMARQLLHPSPPCLIAVGGLSGTGKSTLAQRLAPSVGPVPGAVIIRSDDIRKRLCGVDPLQRLGPQGYTSEVSRRVYDAVVERAAVVVRGGHAAIADAVFVRPSDREDIERAAVDAGVPFVGIWLDAPETELLARIAQRQRDPSDADAEVIRAQLSQDPGPIAWQRCEASGTSEEVHRRAIGTLEDQLGRGILDVASRAPA
jgi:uncharacterized protein